MSTLSHPDLCDREFGSSEFHVATFFDWLKQKKLHINLGPLVSTYEFIQVEALLCAIQGAAVDGLTLEHASKIVANDKVLRTRFVAQGHSQETKAMLAGKLASYDAEEDEVLIGANFTIGGAAHQKWRELISRAIENGELELLDYYSKQPIQVAVPSQPTSSKATKKVRVAWRVVLFENIAKIDAQHSGKASVTEAIRWLRSNGGERIKECGSADQLIWIDDLGNTKTVAKKTVSTALSAARKSH